MKPNVLRQKLESGEPTVSTHIHSTWPSVVEAVGHTGIYDYVEFVAEYGPSDLHDLDNLARAAELFDMGMMIKVDQSHQAYLSGATCEWDRADPSGASCSPTWTRSDRRTRALSTGADPDDQAGHARGQGLVRRPVRHSKYLDMGTLLSARTSRHGWWQSNGEALWRAISGSTDQIWLQVMQTYVQTQLASLRERLYGRHQDGWRISMIEKKGAVDELDEILEIPGMLNGHGAVGRLRLLRQHEGKAGQRNHPDSGRRTRQGVQVGSIDQAKWRKSGATKGRRGREGKEVVNGRDPVRRRGEEVPRHGRRVKLHRRHFSIGTDITILHGWWQSNGEALWRAISGE